MSDSEEAELSGDEDLDYKASPDKSSESYDSDFSQRSEPEFKITSLSL